MSGVRLGLLTVLGLALVAAVAGGALGTAARQRVSPLLGALVGAAAVWTGALAWSGGTGRVVVGTVLPGVTAAYAPDRLGGAFLVLVGGVTVLASVWAFDGARGTAASRTAWVAYPLFVLGLLGVMAAADVVAFLLAWEVMAVASAVLVLADHARRPEVVGAGLWYAGMTQLSFLLVLGGFAVLASAAGGTGWSDLARLAPDAGATGAGVGLLLLGFVTKAGAVPVHVWLPRAHPEAPSHVSALMSAAMVKAGVYGVLLVVVRLLPAGPSWWGLALLVVGSASAVFGILQAGVAADLKRLLAYSTTENVGLILVAVGAAQVTTARGDVETGHVLLVAALLLTFGHAAAKSVLFLTAGSVLHATGLRDLDRLGGLGRTMPWTCGAFGVAALGAAGLPVTAGFVAEWTLLQALVHAGGPADPRLGLVSALAVTVVALTAGLALMTFTKAFGIAFLGRPRSDGAAAAHEVGRAERLAAAVGALAVLGLGLVPGPMATAAVRALGVDGVTAAGTTLAAGVRLGGVAPAPGSAGEAASGTAALVPVLDPLALGLAALAALVVVAGVVARLRRRAPRRAVELGWGCGGARVSPRMQYTATSYAEPLVRIFDAPLGVSRSVATTTADAPYVVRAMSFRQRVRDVFEEHGYRPLLRAAARVGDAGRALHNGSVHRYLAWSFATFVVVLGLAAR
ncbi:proton-conducting transporter membrane subunit [Kineosporia sp. A_224]|uniref:proton-conducting transporter transmembrane domain-containing protein n=1 Tax=Kineosporia sp. A_224 TaxID=1962180 RepID=UPI000B4BE2B2|nr:proton-conducting transporter membrane subunit [Kineosporia sp. A_224]